MNILLLLGIVSLVAIITACWHRSFKMRGLVSFANLFAGTHIKAHTKLTDAAVTTRFLLGKIGSDADHVDICGIADVPSGVMTDEADAAEDQMAVRFLGASDETMKMIPSAAIADGAFVVPDADGKIRTLPVVPGVYTVVGRAVTNGVTDEFMEVDPINPTIVIVQGSGANALVAVAGDALVIPVTHRIVDKTTAGDAEALTLADGIAGQKLHIHLGTDGGGDGTLTPATSEGWATIVFADAGDRAELEFIDATRGWIITGLSGVAAPPVTT